MNDNKDKYRPRLTSLTRLMLTDRLHYLIVVFLTMCFLGKNGNGTLTGVGSAPHFPQRIRMQKSAPFGADFVEALLQI